MRPALLSSMLLLGACGTTLTNREPPPKPFAGTRWDVVLEMPTPGEPPYFRFGDGRMEGFSGCSPVRAEYLQDSVGARAIAMRRIDVDRRVCDASSKLLESRILAVLQSVSSYSITGDVMRMSGSGGTLTLRAHATASTPAAAAPAPAPAPGAVAVASGSSLVGTRWTGVVEKGTPEGNVPRLELVAEGRLAGYTGCNLMNGAWRMEGGEARVGALVTTKRACAGPESGIEKRLLAALSEGRLVHEAGRLVAVGRNGERFEFTPAN
jgi:heat shock protein HslJ